MFRAYSYTKLWLLGAVLISNALWQNSARAEAEQMSSAVNGLSIATIALSATNVISGAKDCACRAAASGTPCPMFSWGTCPMLAASVPMLLMSVSQALQNRKSGKQLDTFKPNFTTGGDNGSIGNGGDNYPPLPGDNAPPGDDNGPAGPGLKLAKIPPLEWGEFCTKAPEFCNDCAKSGNYTNCPPEIILPDSVDPNTFNTPELRDALAAFQQAADLINSSDHGGNGEGNIGDGEDSDFGFAAEDSGAATDPTYVKKPKGLGLGDKTGLEGVGIWGMDMVDEKSGAKLTLWQRATRRYYGAPDLKRLNFLARAEYVRARAMVHAKSRIKAPEKIAAKAEAVGAQAPAPAADQSSAAIVPPTRR